MDRSGVHHAVDLKFDGGTQALASKPELIFAPDDIAHYHKIDGKIVGVGPVHRARPVSHLSPAPLRGGIGPQPTRLWQASWIEGLATYVGSRLCPASSEAKC